MDRELIITTRTAISNGRGFHQNHPDLLVRVGSDRCIRPFGCNHFPNGIRPWDNAEQQRATRVDGSDLLHPVRGGFVSETNLSKTNAAEPAPSTTNWGKGPPVPEITQFLQGPQRRGFELGRAIGIFFEIMKG